MEQRSARTASLVALALALAPAGAPAEPDAPVRISGASPFAECVADDPQGQLGEFTPDSEVEPWVAANPLDPRHLVASWQQDRFTNGGARGLVSAVSFDGGRRWQQVVLPGLSLCSGGEFLRASDPWLAFAANGDLHHIALVVDEALIEMLEGFSDSGRSAMLVQKSTDGGLHWSDPIAIVDETFFGLHDKQTLTADPHDAATVYATWDRLAFDGGGPALFSRTTDAGASWEAPRVVYDPGPLGQTLANQIVVLPDGTLIDFFTEFGPEGVHLALKHSRDRGESWLPEGAPLTVASIEPSYDLRDPDSGMPIRGGEELFDVAVDPTRGRLYAVWQDGRFGGFTHESIALSVSEDGGTSWTPPVRIDAVPDDLPTPQRQAFVPSIAVNEKGVVAVTWYDFRNDDAGSGALTDYWALTCHTSARRSCADPDDWGPEIPLTGGSFDLLLAPLAGGLFLGDYAGLAAAADEFVAVFGTTAPDDPASLVAHRFKRGRKLGTRGR